MKKIISVILLLIVTFSLVACTKKNYEEQFLGSWLNDYDDASQSMFYMFEKDEEGNYTASCIFGAPSGTRPDLYMFERFSATNSEVTFYGNGKELSHEYSFVDGNLMLHGMKFNKTSD